MKRLFIYMFLAGLFCSCDDFLDITPKGKLLPKTLQDYDEMMGDPAHPSAAYPLADMCGDNIVLTENRINSFFTSSTGKAYLWQEAFYTETENDAVWNDAYSKIYTFNLVLERVDGAENGNEEDRRRVKGEARFNRAYYYWFLHSCYAKAYNPATAEKDLSVPLRTDSDLEAKLSRATSAEIVRLLLEDIAHPEDLPEKAANAYRISRGGAYALAARIYLSLGDFKNALQSAEQALKQNSTLLDYNDWSFVDPEKPYSGINNRPSVLRESPECLMYRGCGFPSLNSSHQISDELLACYDTLTDLRYQFNFTRIGRNGKPLTEENATYLQELDYNIGVPEMMLIKAECLARQGDGKCLEVLDELRRHRIRTSDFQPLNVPDNQLLTTVLEERQRELPFHGLRFFDMKRLAEEGLYTRTVTRTFKGETYSLAPNSNRYMFPISSKLMSLNNNIVNNPR